MRSAIGETPGRPRQRRELARGGDGPGREARILRMSDHQRSERAGVGEAAPEHAGVGGDRVSVGEGRGAGVGRNPISTISRPCRPRVRAAIGCTRTGVSALARRATYSSTSGVSIGGLVSGRVTMRGDASRGGGEAGGAEALLVALARLGDLHTKIDDAGRQAQAAAVDAFRIPGPALGDAPVLHHEVAPPLLAPLGVDQAGVGEEEGPHSGAATRGRTVADRPWRPKQGAAVMSAPR